MTDAISKAKLLEYLDSIVGENVVVGIMQKIQSGAFDIPTDADVAEIRDALAKATPGEWECKKGMTVCDVLSPSAKSYIARVTSERNAHIITNAPTWPTWLRQLLTKLAKKEAEIERLRNRYRPAVQWFAEQMERKLRENDHKGGWENENIYWLWERLREESKEMITAVNLTRDVHADPDNIVKEAADVANFAMMIADVARRMKEGGE